MVAQPVTEPVRRRTVEETPERWRRALERSQGLELHRCSETGAWYCSSGSDPGIAHPVTLYNCGCPAGVAGDPVCRHRAALRLRYGLLEPLSTAGHSDQDLETRQAERDGLTDVVVLTSERCGHCRGVGTLVVRDGSEVRCHNCGGGGWLPAAPAAPVGRQGD